MLTALNVQAQTVAGQSLAGRAGAVVVIEPRTGKIPVWVSVPGFDPNEVRTDAGYEELQSAGGEPRLFDRVSQSAYPPGSTFKVVTAAAALDSGVYKPKSIVNGDSPKEFSGKPMEIFD